MFTTNPETEIETEKLAAVLRNLPIDGLASYAELSAAVGYQVQGKPFALIRARKRVEEESGLRFGTVHRQGVKKLAAEAVAGIGADARKRIARTAKRQHTRLSGLKYNNLDASTRARIDAERSLLGAVSAAARADADQLTEITATGPEVANRVLRWLAGERAA